MRIAATLLVIAALAAPVAAEPLEGSVSSVKNDNGKHLHLAWSREPAEGNQMLILRRKASDPADGIPTAWSGDKLPAPNTPIEGTSWTVAYAGDGAKEHLDEVEPGESYVYAFLEGTKLPALDEFHTALVDLRHCMAVHALRARTADTGADPGAVARHLYRTEGVPCDKESQLASTSENVPKPLRDEIAAWRGDAEVTSGLARGGRWADLKPALASLEARRRALDIVEFERDLDRGLGQDPFIKVLRAADRAIWALAASDATADTAKGALEALKKEIEAAPPSVRAQVGELLAVAKTEGALDPVGIAWKLSWARPSKVAGYWNLAHLANSQPVAPVAAFYNTDRTFYLFLVGLTIAAFLYYLGYARRHAKSIFIRRMPGVDAIEDAIGRSTEMGRPVLYVTGIEEIQDIQTLASVLILGHVAHLTADYDTEIKVCNTYPMTMIVAEEVVRQGYANAGRLDAHKPENVMFITSEQFAFAAAVNGMILRDRPATNIYFGRFFAESLMLAETGFLTGAVQIAGTAEFSQLPFFIAACDYTLLGEELYAVGAYLSREPTLLAQLKAGDIVKATAMGLILFGMLLATTEFFSLGPWLMP